MNVTIQSFETELSLHNCESNAAQRCTKPSMNVQHYVHHYHDQRDFHS